MSPSRRKTKQPASSTSGSRSGGRRGSLLTRCCPCLGGNDRPGDIEFDSGGGGGGGDRPGKPDNNGGGGDRPSRPSDGGGVNNPDRNGDRDNGSGGGGGGRRTPELPDTKPEPDRPKPRPEPEPNPRPKPPEMAYSKRYEEIKERCLRTGTLWEDPDFPADSRSLLQNSPYNDRVVWKRPGEISRDPYFGHKDTDYYDMDQGTLGNCWFVASASCLAISPQKSLLKRVIPDDQGFKKREYCGAFYFRFWQYGKWVEVIIDDRLPTLWDKLHYARNRKQRDEYWCPLLEKAYAKLNGSYNNIDGGRVFDSLVDLTGGIGELVPLKSDITSEKLAAMVKNCFRMNSFIGGGIFAPKVDSSTREVRMANGLYQGHAYSVLDVKEVSSIKFGKQTLLHLRNPWGEGEWNGPWADGTREYNSLSDEDRRATLRRHNDGEFWISVDDFRKNFDELELCHLTPDAVTGELAHDLHRNQWRTSEHFGSWVRGVSAGGALTSWSSPYFWTNPQFQLRLADATKPTSVVVSLLEVTDRAVQNLSSIAFVIFKYLGRGRPSRISTKNYHQFSYLEDSGAFWPYRERTRQFMVEHGEYVIIPCTFRRGQEGEFYMRVFCAEDVVTEPLEPDRPVRSSSPDPIQPSAGPTSKESAEDIAKEEFVKIAGTGGVTDADGLMQILNKAFAKENVSFSLSTCRLLALYAKNKWEPGMVNKEEFNKLWKQLSMWRKAFKSLDVDGSGQMEAKELNELFKILDFGEGASAVVDSIIAKYGGIDKSVSEEDFIQSFVQVLNLLSLYKELKVKKKINMPSHEFLAMVLLT